MKCNDCGQPNYTPSSRSDVCKPCFELRGELMKAVKSQTISMDEFQELQRVLASGGGRAASAIRRTLGLTAPDL